MRKLLLLSFLLALPACERPERPDAGKEQAGKDDSAADTLGQDTLGADAFTVGADTFETNTGDAPVAPRAH